MLFRTCIIILILLCAGGCAPDERTGLNVVMSLTEEEWSVFRRKIFPVFEKRHNISIRSYQVSSGRLSTKLEALLHAGRSEIDLFAQDNMSLAPLVNRDLVADLTPYEKDIPGAVYPNLVEANKFGGKLYFMPFRPNVQITYYNREKFGEYGMKPPETWDELLSAGKAFMDKEGTGRILVKGYGGNPTATQVYEFILQAGGDPYAFNGPGCIKAFRFLKDLAPYMSPETGRAKWDTVNDALARREVYIAQNWPFAVPVLIRDYKLDAIDTYSGWAGPAGERHVIGGDVLGIPRNAKFRKEALQLITFLQSKEAQEIMVRELGWPSIRGDAYAVVPGWQKPHFRSVQEALRKGVFRKNVVWWPAYKKYISKAFRDIVLNGGEVRETLDSYKERLDREKALYR